MLERKYCNWNVYGDNIYWSSLEMVKTIVSHTHFHCIQCITNMPTHEYREYKFFILCIITCETECPDNAIIHQQLSRCKAPALGPSLAVLSREILYDNIVGHLAAESCRLVFILFIIPNLMFTDKACIFSLHLMSIF